MTTPDVGVAFSLQVEFGGGAAMLTVRGEVDVFSAPELGAIVDALIDRGHRSVVLDLSELSFMDASGLRVIADRVDRGALAGCTLTIRSPSVMVQRILAITGMGKLVCVEDPDPDLDPLIAV